MSSPLQSDLKAFSFQSRDSTGPFPLRTFNFGAWYMLNDDELRTSFIPDYRTAPRTKKEYKGK